MSGPSSTKLSGEAASAVVPALPLTSSRNLRLQRRCACGAGTDLSRECESCSRSRFSLQRRSVGAGASSGVPGSVERVLSQPGRSLEPDSRQFMESRFGQDFSAVRVHDDAQAASSARDVSALAYTVGQDIVFGDGQYQPHTAQGRHLLAHELAHTVQQRGLQRRGNVSLTDQGPEYRQLELEADRAADAVVRGAPYGMLRASSRPMISRTPASPAPASANAPRAITIEIANVGTRTVQVTQLGDVSSAGAGPVQARFRADPLHLPGQKGQRALDTYTRFSSAGQLQAILQIAGTSAQRTAQWQVRDRTEVLGDSWLHSVRWTAADRDAEWRRLSGGNEFPRTAAGSCNIDHIVELQIAGGNDPANLQALDAEPNQFSGRTIWNQVQALGTAIAREFSVPAGSQVDIQFGGVVVEGALEPHVPVPGRPNSCLMIDHAARAGIDQRATTDASGAAARSVVLDAGGSVNDFVVPTNWGASNRTAPLYTEAANRAASQMISGMLLRTLHFVDANRARVDAQFDPRNRTRLPITVESERGNSLELSASKAPGTPNRESYRIRLSDQNTNIAINYPFLSPGRITRLGFAQDGALTFRGEITPSVPFLPRPLAIIYENETLRLAVELDRQRLRSPLPGFQITDASLNLGLAPTLSATGNLAFALGRPPRPIATGTVTVGADSAGLSAIGQLLVNIPSVDEASGTITYRDRAWAARVVIESSQIRLPNVQRGRLQLDIDESGLRPSGEVELLLPRDFGNLTLGFTREGAGAAARYVYSGRGRLRVPGLREVDVRGRYDGVNLRAEADNIGFAWRGLDGRLSVSYTARGDAPGVIAGTGTVTIARGDVSGSVAVTLHDSGGFSGTGRVAYPFQIQGQRLEASAQVTIDEDEQVRVAGALRFPQPIQLFRRFGDSYRLFQFQRSIPIPGLSIGPVGVVAVIEGGVSARYGIGPGELRNVELEAAFNPLAERIDPNVAFHAELHIPAEAAITGRIGGGLGVEAGLGRVNGTLNVTAELGLRATAGGRFDARYANQRFAVNARPGIEAALNLGLSLDAHARAEAGIGAFSIGTEKTWNLGRRNVQLGQFSVHAPIAWSSDAGFTAPTLDELEWGPAPEIDPGALLAQLFSASASEERSA